jgi:hypothetical protein
VVSLARARQQHLQHRVRIARALGAEVRFSVGGGAFVVATQNPVRFVPVSGHTEVFTHPGKNPWPTPPPIPPKFAAVSASDWKTFFNGRAAATGADDTELVLQGKALRSGRPDPDVVHVE